MADYLKPPTIASIETSDYTGIKTGEKIIIKAEDNVKINSLKIKITKSDKSTVEEGSATLLEGKWTYITTVINSSITGDKIVVTATDRPGNTSTKQITL